MLAILMPLLVGLTACSTVKTVELDNTYIKTQLALLPDVPKIPEYPQINFAVEDGKLTISGSDAVQLLDYFENKMPEYRLKMELYKESSSVIFAALKAESTKQFEAVMTNNTEEK